MRYKLRKILICFSLIFIMSCVHSDDEATDAISEGDVIYNVKFVSSWSEQTHPQGFPDNPHFSGLIGASHNVNAVFWQEGELASVGIEAMAELGGKGELSKEANASIAIGDTYQIISGGGIAFSPGSVEIDIPLDINFPFVTIVSMLAPSPDWFVGVSGLNLLENGVWADNLVVDLYVYDAGTDGGSNYTTPDLDSNPKQPVSIITTGPFLVNGEVRPVGQMIFSKVR